MVLQPNRLPGFVLIVIGILIALAGAFHIITDTLINVDFNINTLSLWIGGVIAITGILVTGLVKEKYAVRIATAEGEKDAVVVCSPRLSKSFFISPRKWLSSLVTFVTAIIRPDV